MTIQNFDFAKYAENFDRHIQQSIPGLNLLGDQCVRLSQRFVQDQSMVLDIGCSTGRLLRAVYRYNRNVHRGVQYVGVDTEPKFGNEWGRFKTANLDFRIGDVRKLSAIGDLSLTFSIFTIQFLPERDKLPVLQRLYDDLLPGGALVIAEKVLASSSRLQDALTFPFYDRKRKFFSAEEILDKERRLRGQMTLWSDAELKSKLNSVGFADVQTIWTSFPFTAVVAVKQV